MGEGARSVVPRAVDERRGHRLRHRVRRTGGPEASSGDARRCRGRYSPTLVDHFLNPRNAGLMREPDSVGEDEYEGCGDLTRFFLRVRDGRAVEIRFQTYGCGPTIAAASIARELYRGPLAGDLCPPAG